jgi:uncharacterized protein YktB (UPF0637 family)
MEDGDFHIIKQSKKYFYIFSAMYNVMYTGEFARLVRMEKDEYINLMKDKFNACVEGTNKELYYKSSEDAEKAIEWIESMILMKKLLGKKI